MTPTATETIKILVSDPIKAEALTPLTENTRFSLVFKTGLKGDELIKELSGCQGLLVRSETKVTADVIKAAKGLKIVGRAGVGLDNIDVAAASKAGIIVMNVPGGNTVSAAEHAVALLLSLSRNIPQADASVKQGLWERKKFVGKEIAGKTLGVLGLGRIGREVSQRAVGLGMEVLGFDPMADPEWCRLMGVKLVPLIDLYRNSDYISLHLPLIKTGENSTVRYLNETAFSEMKQGVRIINCARGPLVDEAALLKAMDSGKVKGAALDVFDAEPLPKDSPLLKHAGLVLTPHLGASTEEAQEKVAVELAKAVKEYFESGTVKNAVNMPVGLPPELKPYQDLAERMGRFIGQLIDGDIKRVSFTYEGLLGRYNPAPFTNHGLAGLLTTQGKTASAVNSFESAKAMGLYVEESAVSEANEYTSLLTFEVKTSKGTRRLSGTVFGGDQPRLVSIDGMGVDIVPGGHMLVFTNVDRPGVVGFIGTLLGEMGVNIAGFDLGRQEKGKEAVSVITVDSPVSEEAMAKIKKHPALISAQMVIV